MKKRGMTVIEAMISMGLFSMLGLLLIESYRYGNAALFQGSNRSRMVQETNAACASLSREIERSLYESLSIGSECCSVLSAVDGNGVFQYAPGTTTPRFQKFMIFYRDNAKSEFKLREVSVVGSPTENTPSTIELFGPSQPVNTYKSGGRVIARSIYQIDLQTNPDKQLIFYVGAALTRPGKAQPDRFVQRCVSSFRN